MIGEKLGPFTITDKLGAGAMGVVYRATWEGTGQTVAVKVIHHDQASKANSNERFDRESDILKQLRHPHIVRHIGVGYSGARGLRYYAMEYVPGTTLEDVLNERESLPWPEVVAQAIQIGEALAYAHEKGVVHRDLKPSNLMITERGVVKLTDFGIAKDLDRTALTADGRTLGTAAYMAPEQIRGTPQISHRTDLYSFGCLLYQMLTGRTPFEGKSAIVLMHKHLDEPPPRPSARNPEIPLALDKLIVHLMAKEPDERPWDAQAVLQTLTELRDRQKRKEPVPMVFGAPGANPSRLGTDGRTAGAAETAAASTTRATGGKPRKSRKTAARRFHPSDLIHGLRARLDVVGMVAGLVVVSALLAYLLLPPSEGYLYRKASQAMDSPTRADWIYARDRYLADLDRRFPDHPYGEQVRAWRDRILIGDVQRRAKILESPTLTGLTEARTTAEEDYLRTYRNTLNDREKGDYELALTRWTELTTLLDPESEDERGWYLHTFTHIDEMTRVLQQRRRDVEALLERAAREYDAGRYDQSAQTYAEIVRDYQSFPDLSDLVAEVMRQRADVTLPPLPPDPTAPPGTGVLGFENTPEGACRALILARQTGDIVAVRRAATPAPEPMLAALLMGISRVPPAKIDEARRNVSNMPLRQLEPGEEVHLGDGTIDRVTADDVAEDRAVVGLRSLEGPLVRLRKIDGLWRVEPESLLGTGEADAATPAGS